MRCWRTHRSNLASVNSRSLNWFNPKMIDWIVRLLKLFLSFAITKLLSVHNVYPELSQSIECDHATLKAKGVFHDQFNQNVILNCQLCERLRDEHCQNDLQIVWFDINSKIVDNGFDAVYQKSSRNIYWIEYLNIDSSSRGNRSDSFPNSVHILIIWLKQQHAQFLFCQHFCEQMLLSMIFFVEMFNLGSLFWNSSWSKWSINCIVSC